MGRNALVISDRLYRPARTLNVGYVTQDYFLLRREKQRAARAPRSEKIRPSNVDPRGRHPTRLYYHAICPQHLEAALGQDGRANAWLHRTVSPAIEATFQPDIVYGSGGELGQGVVDMPYDIPNVRCENGAVANHVRIGW